ncbi:hypothetical protein Sjap_026370 [Stephania japonica]|uniref:Uncharacterized protein n=1 Tax=Stephania japonica TaxID=461633 RepID=A0AAP0EBB7_9MAGN
MGEHYFSIVIMALILCSHLTPLTTTAFLIVGGNRDLTEAVAPKPIYVLESRRLGVVPPRVVVVFNDVTGFPYFDELRRRWRRRRRRRPAFLPPSPYANPPMHPISGAQEYDS